MTTNTYLVEVEVGLGEWMLSHYSYYLLVVIYSVCLHLHLLLPLLLYSQVSVEMKTAWDAASEPLLH